RGANAQTFVAPSLRGRFVKVSEVCVGRSGARLTCPGARVAVDPNGGAILITSLMRNKVVLPVRRTDFGVAAAASSSSSSSATVIFSACALDGFVDTSVFAVLEQETVEAHDDAPLKTEAGSPPSATAAASKQGDAKAAKEGKYLVVYAYVPSLQQVQRTHLVRLPATAHRLVPIPAAPFGPGGVLVCTDSDVICPRNGDFQVLRPLPRRAAFTETLYDPSIIADTVTCVRKDFFMLLQDEQGDLFRVFLSRVSVQQAYDALKAARIQQQQQQALGTAAPPPPVVNPLAVHYFDTIAPASDLSLFPRGFLLAAAETGPFHGLYKIIRDGYTKENEYIVKRVKRVRELPAANAKRQREEDDDNDTNGKLKEEAGDSHAQNVKKEDAHDVDDRKPKATGKLVALLQQQQPQLPSASAAKAAAPPTQTITRVIAIYQPHLSLKHLALVQTYPNTPPCGLLHFFDPDGRRNGGWCCAGLRAGTATREHGRFLDVGSRSSALQRLVQELESTVAHAQALMDAASASSLLGANGANGGENASSPVVAAGKTARMKVLQKLLTTSSNRVNALWTDTLLITTAKGTTASYHVSRTMEPDWWTGFTTAERTLAAATLKYGVGYVQVTPKAIYVLPPTPKEDRERERRGDAAPASSTASHAAYGGGLASFSFGLTGTQLEKIEDLPTFPTSPAVSLLQPSAESLTGSSTNAQFNAFLFGGAGGRHRHASSSSAASQAAAMGDELELAAIATMSQEVYLLNPRNLREQIDKINCQDVGSSGGSEEIVVTGEDGGVTRSNSGAIASVLLTYLGGGSTAYAQDGSGKSGAKGSGGGGSVQQRQQQRGKRLFCFIGHMNGMLTRCELDPVTAKVMDREELTCGVAPCRMISGDGQSVCYIQSGAHAWRLKKEKEEEEAEEGERVGEENDVDEEEERQNGASLTFITAASASSGTTGSGTGGGAGLRDEPPHPAAHDGPRLLYPLVHGASRVQYHGYQADAGGATGADEAGAAAAPQSGPISLDAPQRALGHADFYNSTLQLYHEESNRMFPRYFFTEGEAVLCGAIGSFVEDFGREPVMVVGAASQYSHGAGCGAAPAGRRAGSAPSTLPGSNRNSNTSRSSSCWVGSRRCASRPSTAPSSAQT
ncbi:uncharacterized protein LOC126767363, partial [Bactrocera neohumeralis]|uniref:uncharacterized protein LOC126767363 n=1 Tax=Bactrocera neohumeralis TaxID=98809 RepID=UPI002166315B